ncbi:MAG: hypothetical protein H5T69_05755 [Chloroflexi bacterium]|nr:hypothetical protein [Chloroflexota bacterium]
MKRAGLHPHPSVESKGPLPRLLMGRAYKALVAVLYVLGSLWILIMWTTDVRPFVGLNLLDKARVLDVVFGRAHRPFVYRVLVPWLVRLLLALLPEGIERWFSTDIYVAFPLVGQMMDFLSWEREYLPVYLAIVFLTYIAIIGFMLSLRWIADQNYRMPRYLLDALPFFSLLILPVFFKRGTHFLYDMPALFLFTLGLACLRAEKHRWYYTVYILGLLNKETMLLLGLVFVLWHRGRKDRRSLWGHAGVHLFLFALIKGGLALLYRDNPGAQAEFRLGENLIFYTYPYWFTTVASVVAVVLLIGHRWQEKPLFLRQALWLVPPFLLLYLVMGSWGEIRVFYELFAVLFLLGFQTIAWIMGWPMVAREESGSEPLRL